jgi:hypothetical protein
MFGCHRMGDLSVRPRSDGSYCVRNSNVGHDVSDEDSNVTLD